MEQLPSYTVSTVVALLCCVLLFLSAANVAWIPLTPSSGISTETDPSLGIQQEKLTIVATSTVISTIAAQVGGDNVKVHTLIPAGFCPGHYDLRPKDIATLNNSDLLLAHGTEFQFQWFKDLLHSIEAKPIIKNVSRTWQNPQGARQITNHIVDALVRYGNFDSECEQNREEVMTTFNRTVANITSRSQTKKVSDINVVCMLWQKPFVQWIGYNVVDTYKPPETLSSARVSALINKGKEQGVGLVIDNLQSGTEIGEKLAEEIGCVHVVLSNFPQAVKDTNTLSDLYRYNWDQLADKTNAWRDLKDEINLRRRAERRAWFFTIMTGMLAAISIIEGIYIYVHIHRKPEEE